VPIILVTWKTDRRTGFAFADLQLTWQTFGNTTNVIQWVTPVVNGNCTNNFINLSTIIVPGSGAVTTNWLDVGALTATPARYYRIRLQLGPPCAN
jgi:hypothetical protein